MENKMNNIAWIGSRKSFENTFGVHHNTDCYVDKENNVCYWCIDSEDKALGKTFDKAVMGYIDYHREDEVYYYELLGIVESSRIR